MQKVWDAYEPCKGICVKDKKHGDSRAAGTGKWKKLLSYLIPFCERCTFMPASCYAMHSIGPIV